MKLAHCMSKKGCWSREKLTAWLLHLRSLSKINAAQICIEKITIVAVNFHPYHLLLFVQYKHKIYVGQLWKLFVCSLKYIMISGLWLTLRRLNNTDPGIMIRTFVTCYLKLWRSCTTWFKLLLPSDKLTSFSPLYGR